MKNGGMLRDGLLLVCFLGSGRPRARVLVWHSTGRHEEIPLASQSSELIALLVVPKQAAERGSGGSTSGEALVSALRSFPRPRPIADLLKESGWSRPTLYVKASRIARSPRACTSAGTRSGRTYGTS
jgi:hypothetical protein